jgi:hypothetical protein
MYSAYIDGNTIDEIVGAGEDFVYSDIYPQLSGVIGREKLYEALAGASEGFAQEEVMIQLNGDPLDGLRGCVAVMSASFRPLRTLRIGWQTSAGVPRPRVSCARRTRADHSSWVVGQAD